jgi:3-isopropylmalate/(R)-2-methylmalate dehydratase small subunit
MTNSRVIDRVQGSAVPIPGNDVDTDRIVPARYLKEVTFEKMGDYLFYDARYRDGQPTDHPLNNPIYQGASIMLVENNFGCGSSREHAPQAIKRAGFQAIIGESFAEIFSGNCKALGIVTVMVSTLQLKAMVTAIQATPKAMLTVDVSAQEVVISGCSAPFSVKIKPTHRNAFLAGTWDELAVLKSNDDAITTVAQGLPYFNW